MGTRSLTFVHNEFDEVVLNMYRQYDGYLSGHGMDLAKILDDSGHWGAGCLAATIVAKMKNGVGGIYLHSPDQIDCGQDYDYHVSLKNDEPHIKVVRTYDDTIVFEGGPKELVEMVNREGHAAGCNVDEEVVA